MGTKVVGSKVGSKVKVGSEVMVGSKVVDVDVDVDVDDPVDDGASVGLSDGVVSVAVVDGIEGSALSMGEFVSVVGTLDGNKPGVGFELAARVGDVLGDGEVISVGI